MNNCCMAWRPQTVKLNHRNISIQMVKCAEKGRELDHLCWKSQDTNAKSRVHSWYCSILLFGFPHTDEIKQIFLKSIQVMEVTNVCFVRIWFAFFLYDIYPFHIFGYFVMLALIRCEICLFSFSPSLRLRLQCVSLFLSFREFLIWYLTNDHRKSRQRLLRTLLHRMQ